MKCKVLFAVCTVVLLCFMIAFSQADVLRLPLDTKIIGEMSFYGNSSLDEVVLPEGVEEIQTKAFRETGLRKITLPGSLTSIADDALDPDEEITVVAFKGTYAYEWAMAKGYHVVSYETTTWGNYECYYLADGNGGLIVHITGLAAGSKVTTLTFESKLNGQTISALYIDDSAFENCTQLMNVPVFPDNLKAIGKRAFAGCIGLGSNYSDNTLIIPASVELIDDSAFQGCSKMSFLEFSDQARLVKIGNYAFEGWQYLFRAEIPASVVYLAKNAFDNCKESIYIIRATRKTADGNIGYYLDTDHAVVSSYNGPTDNAIIPAEIEGWPVTCIGVSTFMDTGIRENLEKVYLPDSITQIEDDESNTAGVGLFSGCTALEEVHLPSSITKINYSMFNGCTSLRTVNIPNTITYVGGNAFDSCSSLTGISLPYGVKTIDRKAFYKCTNLKGVSLPVTLTKLGEEAFYMCSSLKSICIPSGVSCIEAYTFRSCSNLTSVYLPQSLVTIMDYAFYNCRKLTSVTFPNSVTTIGEAAFADCKELKEIKLPKQLISIGGSAFYKCESLKNVIIPYGTEELGYYVFDYCTGLEGVTIPETVTTINSITGKKWQNAYPIIYADEGTVAYQWAKEVGYQIASYTTFTFIGGKVNGLPFGELPMGEPFSFSGIYRTNEEIVQYRAKILLSNSTVKQEATGEVHKTYLPFSVLRSNLLLEELAVGSYSLSIEIQTEGSEEWKEIARTYFSIVLTSTRFGFMSGSKMPKGLYPQGRAFEAKGELRANRTIENVRIEVTKSSDNTVVRNYSIMPNALSCSMQTVFSELHMETLEADYYTIRLWMTVEGTEKHVTSSSFRIYYYDGSLNEETVTRIIRWCSDPNNREVLNKFNAYREYLDNMNWTDVAAMVFTNYSDIIRDNVIGQFTGAGCDEFVVKLYKKKLVEMLQTMETSGLQTSYEFDSFEKFFYEKGKNIAKLDKIRTKELLLLLKEYQHYLEQEESGGPATILAKDITQKDIEFAETLKEGLNNLEGIYNGIEYSKDTLDLIFSLQGDYQRGLQVLESLSRTFGDRPSAELMMALQEVIDEYHNDGLRIISTICTKIEEKVVDKAIDTITDGVLIISDAVFHSWPGTASLYFSIAKFSMKLLSEELMDFDDLADDNYDFLTHMNLMLECRKAYTDSFDAVSGGDTSSGSIMQVFCTFDSCKYATEKVYDVMIDQARDIGHDAYADGLEDVKKMVHALRIQ